jgi:predicted nucleic acid-binding protein
MLSLVNQYIVVLDACVLLPMPICDTLLRLAEEPAFYLPRWSRETLAEIHRNLQKWGYSSAQADRRIRAMQEMFEDAEVVGYEELLTSMTNHPDDRHVLAAAVRSGAHAIVTDNIRHFPPESTQPYGIEVMTGDEFLTHQFHLDSDGVTAKLEAQAAKLKATIPQLLQRLGNSAPSFATLIATSCESDSF